MLEKGTTFTCEKQGGKTNCQQQENVSELVRSVEWTVRWKENCLNSGSQKVVVNDTGSNWRPAAHGVPQGLILCPV